MLFHLAMEYDGQGELDLIGERWATGVPGHDPARGRGDQSRTGANTAVGKSVGGRGGGDRRVEGAADWEDLGGFEWEGNP